MKKGTLVYNVDYRKYKDEDLCMLLGRLVSDCEYFLGYGNGYEGHLWGGSVEKHTWYMKDMFNVLTRRGVEVTLVSKQGIEEYKKAMLAVKYANRG